MQKDTYAAAAKHNQPTAKIWESSCLNFAHEKNFELETQKILILDAWVMMEKLVEDCLDNSKIPDEVGIPKRSENG